MEVNLVLNAPFWKLLVGNPGRESGDRGKSIFNYRTGAVAYVLSLGSFILRVSSDVGAQKFGSARLDHRDHGPHQWLSLVWFDYG